MRHLFKVRKLIPYPVRYFGILRGYLLLLDKTSPPYEPVKTSWGSLPREEIARKRWIFLVISWQKSIENRRNAKENLQEGQKPAIIRIKAIGSLVSPDSLSPISYLIYLCLRNLKSKNPSPIQASKSSHSMVNSTRRMSTLPSPISSLISETSISLVPSSISENSTISIVSLSDISLIPLSEVKMEEGNSPSALSQAKYKIPSIWSGSRISSLSTRPKTLHLWNSASRNTCFFIN